jgi:hypothetical protein
VISQAWVKCQQQGGLTRKQWEAFCAEYEIVYEPKAAGRNVYFAGGRTGIECVFGEGVRGPDAEKAGPPEFADHVVFQTFWGGPYQRRLARLVAAFWVRFGGSLFADEETRKLICAGDPSDA